MFERFGTFFKAVEILWPFQLSSYWLTDSTENYSVEMLRVSVQIHPMCLPIQVNVVYKVIVRQTFILASPCDLIIL